MTTSAPGARHYVTSDLATLAPHVRNTLDVRAAMYCVLAAALPCALMALYNTGYQVNRVLAGSGASAGWRTRLLETAGLGHAPASAVDCVALGALFLAPLLAATWLAGGAAEWCFARARGRRPDHVALPVIAVLFALCLPASLPAWQAAIGAAIGVVIGKEIFGGFGRNFVNPVVVGLAFLYFAYPGALVGDGVWVPLPGHLEPSPLAIATRSGLDGVHGAGLAWSSAALGRVPGAMGETSALACLLGLGILLHTGVASWRIVAGGLLGLIAGVWSLQALGATSPIAQLPWYWHLVSGSFAFGLVYLATDPVTAATTDAGRWIYGGIIGALVAAVRIANPAYQDGVLLALLLGNVAAPLVDRMVALVQLRQGARGVGGG